MSILFKYVLDQQYLLGAALQISGEATALTPPNPNSKWNENRSQRCVADNL